jgi:hypothetical protein
MAIEFTVEKDVGRERGESCAEVSEHTVRPDVLVSGLKGVTLVKRTNSVELGLDANGVGETVSVVTVLEGEHGFHRGRRNVLSRSMVSKESCWRQSR